MRKKNNARCNDQMITNTTCKMDVLQFEAFIQHFDYFDSTWRTPGVASIKRFNFPCFPCLFWQGISSKRETYFLLVGLDMCTTLAPGRGGATENAKCCDAVRNAVLLASKPQKRNAKTIKQCGNISTLDMVTSKYHHRWTK